MGKEDSGDDNVTTVRLFFGAGVGRNVFRRAAPLS